MTRTARRLRPLLGLALVVAGLLAPMGAAAAHDGHDHGAEQSVVDVVEVNGLLDPVLLEVVADALESVDPAETIALVLQVDSRGSVVPDADVTALADLVLDSPVPVSVWVGPSGSRALGAVAQLVGLADDVGIAPGARIGDLGEPVLSAASHGAPFGLAAGSDLVDGTVGYAEAVERGLARPSPVLLEHLRGIPGFEGAADDGEGTTPVVRTRFHKPGSCSPPASGSPASSGPARSCSAATAWRCCRPAGGRSPCWWSPCSATPSTRRPACRVPGR